jgi:hypothetical protein
LNDFTALFRRRDSIEFTIDKRGKIYHVDLETGNVLAEHPYYSAHIN